MQSNRPRLIESVFVNKIRQQLHAPKLQAQQQKWYNQVGGFVQNNLILVIMALLVIAFLLHRYYYPKKDVIEEILDDIEEQEDDDVTKIITQIKTPAIYNKGYTPNSHYNSHPITWNHNPMPIPLSPGADTTQLSLNTSAYMDPYSFSISGALPSVPYSTSYGQFVPNVGFNINPENQLPHSNYLNYGQNYMR